LVLGYTRSASIWSPVAKVWRVLIELSAQLVIVCATLGGIRLIEYVMERLWGHELVLFDRLQIRYVFDGCDLVVIVVFSLYGAMNLCRAYLSEPRELLF
jgi:hypothetical protein